MKVALFLNLIALVFVPLAVPLPTLGQASNAGYRTYNKNENPKKEPDFTNAKFCVNDLPRPLADLARAELISRFHKKANVQIKNPGLPCRVPGDAVIVFSLTPPTVSPKSFSGSYNSYNNSYRASPARTTANSSQFGQGGSLWGDEYGVVVYENLITADGIEVGIAKAASDAFAGTSTGTYFSGSNFSFSSSSRNKGGGNNGSSTTMATTTPADALALARGRAIKAIANPGFRNRHAPNTKYEPLLGAAAAVEGAFGK